MSGGVSHKELSSGLTGMEGKLAAQLKEQQSEVNEIIKQVLSRSESLCFRPRQTTAGVEIEARGAHEGDAAQGEIDDPYGAERADSPSRLPDTVRARMSKTAAGS